MNYLKKLTQDLMEKDEPYQEELKKMRKLILIVDDDPTNVMILKIILESTGHKLLYATNGLEAYQMYIENPKISLIYMDIMMPVMNGIEATKKIRQYEINNDISRCYIIAVTAYEEKKKECLDNGIDEVIIKPIYNSESILKNLDNLGSNSDNNK